MTIQECFRALGGDYNDMFSRVPSENLIVKFVLKFPADTSFKELTESLDAGLTQEAFRAAHTLKGVCANMSFKKLAKSASQITEMLRSGDIDAAKRYYPVVEVDYNDTISAIEQYRLSK